jgi:DNA-binding MarR family transcriptional regulator
MSAPDAKPAWMPHQPADRILSTLKTRGALGIPDIAKVLNVTVEAVRQQMAKLETEGLVDAESRSSGRGRPTQIWRLTGEGHKRFPDTHAEMTVQMISAVISVFGEKGMDQLIGAREAAMRANYTEAMRGARSLKDAAGAAGRNPQPRGLHGRVPADAGDGPGRLSLHREPLPDLHRGAGLHGLLPQRTPALRRSAGARRERQPRRARAGGRAALRLPGRTENRTRAKRPLNPS